MPRTIWIARHGNRQDYADSNWAKTAARPHDPGLSSDGLRQAQELGQRLAPEPIDHIFASPFLRTVETAAVIAEHLNRPVKLALGLCEHLSPQWFRAMPSLLPPPVLAERFPQIDLSYRDRTLPQYPETWPQALARAGQAAQHLSMAFPDNLLMVGHGASMLGATRGLVPHRPRIKRSLCSLVKLVHQNGEWRMELNGDTSHLSFRSNRFVNFYQYWFT